jgi:hypothetical protein
MAGAIGQEMFATYQVRITGVQRTQKQIDALDGIIKQIRGTSYGEGFSATAAANLSGKDVFRTKFDEVIGHVQEKAIVAVREAMKGGKDIQAQVLRAAVTPTGLKRAGNGPGRDKTGEMISEIAANVEVSKSPTSTNITGSHGWGLPDTSERGTPIRRKYLAVQEKGNRSGGTSRQPNRKPIQAANSLGTAIPIVREELKRNLNGLTK